MIEIISCNHEEIIINHLNNLEDEEFFKLEPNKNLLEIFLKDSQVRVYQGEGQDIRGGIMLLGTRVGPSRHDLGALVHEIAHLIEIDDARAMSRNWGFDYSYETTELGMPISFNGSLREARTISIHCKIFEMIGYDFDLKSELSSLYLMEDFINVPGDQRKEREEYLYQYALNYFNSLTEESILFEWLLKNNLLEEMS